MNKNFARDWLVIFLLVILGGALLGCISRYFQTSGPSYALNAAQQCIVKNVTLTVAPSTDNIARTNDTNRPSK